MSIPCQNTKLLVGNVTGLQLDIYYIQTFCMDSIHEFQNSYSLEQFSVANLKFLVLEYFKTSRCVTRYFWVIKSSRWWLQIIFQCWRFLLLLKQHIFISESFKKFFCKCCQCYAIYIIIKLFFNDLTSKIIYKKGKGKGQCFYSVWCASTWCFLRIFKSFNFRQVFR